MKEIEFPLFKTKSDIYKRFDLTDPKSRREYFEYKAGEEIKKLKEFLRKNTFIAYLLGKKSSGKGTYSKMLAEIINEQESEERVVHFSIGDMVRSFDETVKDEKSKKELIFLLEKNYRGYLPLSEVVKALEERSTTKLLPTELILTLAKKEIEKIGRKAIFIDGFPRDLDQVSYSLFFRDLIGYRDDPDVFVLIDVPTMVINERIKSRVVCPACQTSRNLKLLPTKEIEYDERENKFYLLCDNPSCSSYKESGGARMVTKEGDELGIEPIKERLTKDELLVKQALSLEGIPKILLRNSLPIDKAQELVDDYEITPQFIYHWDEKERKVKIEKSAWQIIDDNGVLSYSLMPPPVVVSLIKQLVKVLDI